MLVDQAVVVPGPVTEALGAAAREPGVYLVIGVDEREPHGTTIFNTTLYFAPDGRLLGKHRKLMPTGSERTVWGMGDGSTLPVVATPYGRLSGLTCWENFMPLARFYLYAQGVDIWAAPTLASGDRWITSLRHVATEAGCYVIGVNPCLHADQIPIRFSRTGTACCPTRANDDPWLEPGNSVIIAPNGEVLAGPAAPRRVDPDRRGRPGRGVRPHVGCSTRSATTTDPTCSDSASTPVPVPPSFSVTTRSPPGVTSR